jgi:hypothetical protein
VVYDVNRAPTFEAVKKWKNDIDNKVMIPTGMIPTILLANKCDLLKDPVDKAELMKFCTDNDFKGWCVPPCLILEFASALPPLANSSSSPSRAGSRLQLKLAPT